MKKITENEKKHFQYSNTEIALKKIRKIPPVISSNVWLMDFSDVAVTVKVSDN